MQFFCGAIKVTDIKHFDLRNKYSIAQGLSGQVVCAGFGEFSGSKLKV